VAIRPWPSEFEAPRIVVDDRLAVDVVTHRLPQGSYRIELSGDAAELPASDGFEEAAAILLTAAMEEDQAAVLLAKPEPAPISGGRPAPGTRRRSTRSA
jgi:hypothetical protein